jgi:hypothetical protein
MPQNNRIDFLDAHQDRSKRTLDDLLEAAYSIVDAADPDAFNSRNLADKSGYALGTLNKRLGSIENVFIWAIEKGRDHKLQDVINLMTEFDPHSSLQEFSEGVVNISFRNIGMVGPRVMRYYENKLMTRDGTSLASLDYTSVFIEPYLTMVNANQSNTFRKLSQDETRMIFKSMLTLIERPFINNDPIAGNDEHRRIAIETLIRLLGK